MRRRSLLRSAADALLPFLLLARSGGYGDAPSTACPLRGLRRIDRRCGCVHDMFGPRGSVVEAPLVTTEGIGSPLTRRRLLPRSIGSWQWRDRRRLAQGTLLGRPEDKHHDQNRRREHSADHQQNHQLGCTEVGSNCGVGKFHEATIVRCLRRARRAIDLDWARRALRRSRLAAATRPALTAWPHGYVERVGVERSRWRHVDRRSGGAMGSTSCQY
jgi:hypothetical protein